MNKRIGLLDEERPSYISPNILDHISKQKCVDDIALLMILDTYNETGKIALKNMGRGYSKKYLCKNPGNPNNIIEIHTFLGRNSEYIILPKVGYCGCFTKYKINISRRRICYHLLAFNIDSHISSVTSYEFIFDTYNDLIHDFFLENFPSSNNEEI